eukprot:TRINITY_DN12928_c0_g1_i1.p1 TRINITY_DN12928_c0_g1~~TRINITY_DN12928_c0_g1_i1.p1  ORF type:complete len:273 (+),score=38.39 TRINITY_DN12928_c0_g1_i1:49-867(+)
MQMKGKRFCLLLVAVTLASLVHSYEVGDGCAFPCGSDAEFPLHDAWQSHVVINALLYQGPYFNEKGSWDAVATEYSSFSTRQHAIVSDASLHYTDVQYCLGMGSVGYTSSNVLSEWNTNYARVIYNQTNCVYSDYEFANSNSGFAWLACNIRLFGFESALCSSATAETPVVPTCCNSGYGDRWEWSWTFDNGESEQHWFWVNPTNGHYLKYEWSGKTSDGCVFNETLVFNDFSPTLNDQWFSEPPSGLESCVALDFPSPSFCSLVDPNCVRP